MIINLFELVERDQYHGYGTYDILYFHKCGTVLKKDDVTIDDENAGKRKFEEERADKIQNKKIKKN